MSVVAILRLRPYHLSLIKVQTGNNAGTDTIADVLTSLQSNASTELLPLNTVCPTCQNIDNDPTGFLEYTKPGTTTKYKLPCTTCGGNLLYHTAEGIVTPPTNPFEATLDIRLLPADFFQAITGFPSTTTVADLITALQANYDAANLPTHTCPKCSGSGIFTNAVPAKVWCSLCQGVGKTFIEYTYANGVQTVVVPDIPPPEVLPTLDEILNPT